MSVCEVRACECECDIFFLGVRMFGVVRCIGGCCYVNGVFVQCSMCWVDKCCVWRNKWECLWCL